MQHKAGVRRWRELPTVRCRAAARTVKSCWTIRPTMFTTAIFAKRDRRSTSDSPYPSSNAPEKLGQTDTDRPDW